jgi:hypothetical protein
MHPSPVPYADQRSLRLARLLEFRVRWHHISSRVAGAVVGVREELEEGADSCQHAPPGRVGECSPVKLCQEALKMPALNLLGCQHLDAGQILAPGRFSERET